MTLIPAAHSRFGRFRSGLLGGGSRGGPLRLVGIVSAIVFGVGAVFFASMQSDRFLLQSQVAKMKPGNLLPGGLLSTPQQDALLKTDSQEKARQAEEAHKSFTPAMPGSQPFNGRLPLETGMGDHAGFQPTKTKVEMPPAPAIVPEPAPAYTPPQWLAPDPEINGTRVEKIAAGDSGEAEAAAAEAQSAHQQRQKAIEDMLNGWNSRPPQTTVVIEPTVLKDSAGDPPALTKGLGAGTAPEKVLVPAGRGIYAHTILAVDSDTNGPIVLEADTGPIAGDRMIGAFSKSGLDRLIVKVQTVEHRGKTLEANGIVVAPDSMEEAVATSVDQHYLERFVLPAAAAFVEGLGQAVALGNSTTSVSPFGGMTQTFGPLTFKQEAMVAGGAAAQAVGNAMTASIPRGPTVHLAANVSVGVMFLTNISIK
jgi:intracellular multiplication protein IcmE